MLGRHCLYSNLFAKYAAAAKDPTIAILQKILSSTEEPGRCGQPWRLVASQKVFIARTEYIYVEVIRFAISVTLTVLDNIYYWTISIENLLSTKFLSTINITCLECD